MDRIIQEVGFKARKLTWSQLTYEARVEGVSEKTISNTTGNTMAYSNFFACWKC
jgi:hypothetical protein